jgi:hypothetical protein
MRDLIERFRCVLRMGGILSSSPERVHYADPCCSDHHCPWVNNCIGHHNYGHFLRFLIYVDVACSYHVAMVTRRVLDGANLGYFVSLCSRIADEIG